MADLNRALSARYGLVLDDEVGIIYGASDPSVTGEDAPVGSLLLCSSPIGLFLKSGPGNHEWSRVDGASSSPGDTGAQGVTGTGLLGATGTQGATGVAGSTGLQGASGEGLFWIQAAMLGAATNTNGQFSVQPGNANPFGVPIGSPSGQYNNGAVNALKVPFDFDIKEVYLTLGHCAVGTSTASSTVYATLEFFRYLGTSSVSLGTVKVPLNGANCGVSNNLGGNNFQSSSVVDIASIGGQSGDLIGFVFRNVSGSTTDLNAVSRCTVAAKLQRKNWTPGGNTGATGAQGVTGLPGDVGTLGPQGATGSAGVTGLQGMTGVGQQGYTGLAGAQGWTGVQGTTGIQGFTGTLGPVGQRGATGVSGDVVMWLQASMLGAATNTVGYFSTQPGNANPFGVPVASLTGNYGAGGVNAFRMPWDYVVTDVFVNVAHVAVSAANAAATVLLNLDVYTFTGSTRTKIGRVSIPLNGGLCGVSNNLGGDNYQAASVSGQLVSGTAGDLVGFVFQNVTGNANINALSRCTVLMKVRDANAQ